MDSTSAADSKRSWGVNFTRWLLIFLLIHPLSLGPVLYLDGRGWINMGSPGVAFALFYSPEIYVLMYDVPLLTAPSEWYRRYVTWWQDLAKVPAVSTPVATPAPTPAP